MSKNAIVTMLAETHIHPGVGQSTGALDLPVSRERTTHYPFIPGSGVKGAFRVWAGERAELNGKIDVLFGPATADGGDALKAGHLLCSDARLLLLPVRCLSDAFKWVTCPAILARFQRDCERAEVQGVNMSHTDVGNGYHGASGTREEWLGLEEREFALKDEVADDSGIVEALGKIVSEEQIKKRLVILSDKDFTWFARYALPVMARNKLEERTKKSKNLWYEEMLAPDTVMYVLLGERPKNGAPSGAASQVTSAIKDKARYIQIGGNETVGQGWFSMQTYPGLNAGGGSVR